MIHVKKTNKIFQTKKNNGSPKTYSGDTHVGPLRALFATSHESVAISK